MQCWKGVAGVICNDTHGVKYRYLPLEGATHKGLVVDNKGVFRGDCFSPSFSFPLAFAPSKAEEEESPPITFGRQGADRQDLGSGFEPASNPCGSAERALSSTITDAALDELHLISRNLLRLSKLSGQAIGRNLAALVAAHRQLWLSQARVLDGDKTVLLDAPITPGHTFGPAVDKMLQQSQHARESTRVLLCLLPNRPPPPRRPAAQWHPRPQLQKKPAQQAVASSGTPIRRLPATAFCATATAFCAFKRPVPRQQTQAVPQAKQQP
ncbi:UNVERIFIED_CONTAM: hypothetical protein FKN15_002638 [Acipenser sinensis]